MARKNKEDGVDRFVRRMENFGERMSKWADDFSERMEKKHGSSFSYNSSEITQNGKKIVVKSINKTMTITVNGKVVYEEK